VAAVEASGGTAEVAEADVACEEAVRAMVRNVKRAHGRIDVLVNNAGITADGFAAMMSLQKWSAVLDTNLTGAFLCSREVMKVMLAQGNGSIVNVSSIAGLVGTAGQANYSAAKAGLIGLTKSLAGEAGPRGVRVNAVIPGFIDTDMLHTLPPGELDRQLTHVLLGRSGTADEVAAAVGWLAGGEASYVTGATLVVDGGLTRH
jgi:3-oxoacyl-[acyl-carrier protein] reductase